MFSVTLWVTLAAANFATGNVILGTLAGFTAGFLATFGSGDDE